MRITMVPSSGIVGVDGVFHQINMTDFPADVHAVQWNGTTGEIEFTDKGNEIIYDIAPFQAWVDRWIVANTPILPTLAELKERKKADIEQARNAGCVANVEALGTVWQADKLSQELLNKALGLAVAGAPLPAVWRDIYNNDLPITGIVQLVAIAGAMGLQTQEAYARSWILKPQIEAALTVEELELIVW